MVINLDVLVDPLYWPKSPVVIKSGLEVIDECLERRGTNMPITRSPRKKNVPSKLKGFAIEAALSGTCPKCQLYVEKTDNGVACETCQAFWHYSCAGVTQEELDDQWSNKPFLCPEHQVIGNIVNHSETPLNKFTAQSKEVQVLTHRVYSYTLNPETTIKKQLSNLNLKPKIEPKDKGQQYYIRVSPPSYEMLVANMTEFGKQWGITVKAGGLDNEGTKVATQFNVDLKTHNGLQAVVSMNCYWTNSSIHLQLNKGSKVLGEWEEKLACFSHFVSHNLHGALQLIEKTDEFIELKERMKCDLQNQKATNRKKLTLPHSSSGSLSGYQEVSLGTAKEQAQLSKPRKIDLGGRECPTSPEKILYREDNCELGLNDATLGNNADNKLQREPNTSHDIINKQEKQEFLAVIQNQRIEVAEKDNEILRLKSEIRLLKDAKKELELANTKVTELEEKREKIMRCKEQLGNTIQTLKQEKETAENQVKVLQDTVASQKSTIELNAQLIRDLQLKVASHRNLALTFMDEVYEKDLSKDEEKEMNVSAPNHNNAFLLKEVSDLEKENKMLQAKLRQAEQDANAAEESSSKELKESQSKDGIIQLRDDEIESLKAELKRLGIEKSDEVNGLKKMVRNVEAQAISSQGQYNSLNSELESAKLGKKSLQLEVTALQKKLTNNQAELSTTNMLVDKLKSKATEPEVWNAMKANLDDKDLQMSELKETENFLNSTRTSKTI